MTDGATGSRLAKIAAVVGIAVGLATIISISWTILHKEKDPGIDAYRQLVLASCQQVHDVLAAEHNEVLEVRLNPGSDNPTDMFRVKKGPMLAVMGSNLAQSREIFGGLEQHDVPDQLAEPRTKAIQAQKDWYKAFDQTIALVRKRFPDRGTLTRFNDVGAQAPIATANVKLNNAMTALAGENCKSTN